MTDRERRQLTRIVMAMMSNGCCPCPTDMCDCFGAVRYEAARDVALYVKEVR
jgi:hypothetical protein